MAYSPDVRDAILRELGEGQSVPDLVRTYWVPGPTIRRWRDGAKMPRNRLTKEQIEVILLASRGGFTSEAISQTLVENGWPRRSPSSIRDLIRRHDPNGVRREGRPPTAMALFSREMPKFLMMLNNRWSLRRIAKAFGVATRSALKARRTLVEQCPHCKEWFDHYQWRYNDAPHLCPKIL